MRNETNDALPNDHAAADDPQPQSGALPRLAAEPARWALFLDVDGTLLDIAATPDAVVVSAQLKEALTRLRDHLGGALALISGRSTAQLDALFDPVQLPVAGLHGAQWRGADQQLHSIAIDETASQQMRLQAAELAAGLPGVLLEDKGMAIALHWRRAPAVGDELGRGAQAIAERTGATLQPGKFVFELKPSGVDKGTALRRLLAEPPFAGRSPIFVGDDLTDAFAMSAAKELGGWVAAVGDTLAEVADTVFPTPAAVRAWLRECSAHIDRLPLAGDQTGRSGSPQVG